MEDAYLYSQDEPFENGNNGFLNDNDRRDMKKESFDEKSLLIKKTNQDLFR